MNNEKDPVELEAGTNPWRDKFLECPYGPHPVLGEGEGNEHYKNYNSYRCEICNLSLKFVILEVVDGEGAICRLEDIH